MPGLGDLHILYSDRNLKEQRWDVGAWCQDPHPCGCLAFFTQAPAVRTPPQSRRMPQGSLAALPAQGRRLAGASSAEGGVSRHGCAGGWPAGSEPEEWAPMGERAESGAGQWGRAQRRSPARGTLCCQEQEGARQLERGHHPGGETERLRAPRAQGVAFQGDDPAGPGGESRLDLRRPEGQPRQPRRGRRQGLHGAGRGRCERPPTTSRLLAMAAGWPEAPGPWCSAPFPLPCEAPTWDGRTGSGGRGGGGIPRA